jgi:SWI/SNF chromatin-remodeling complex subunit SWI1
MLLSHFGLPEQFHVPQPNNQNSVATALSQHYVSLLYPFEDAYKRNVQEQQRRVMLSARHPGSKSQQSLMINTSQGLRPHHQDGATQSNNREKAPITSVGSRGRPVGSSPSPGSNSHSHHRAPDTPHSRPPSRPGNDAHSSGSTTDSKTGGSPLVDGMLLEHFVDKNLLDPDIQGIKRKPERDGADGKRVRQKIGRCSKPQRRSIQ